MALLFGRLRKRAGMSDQEVTPSVLRDTCAVRYLQTGGTLEGLCEVLGLTSVAALKRYERLSVQEYEPEPLLTESTEEPTVQARARSPSPQAASEEATTEDDQQPAARGRWP